MTSRVSFLNLCKETLKRHFTSTLVLILGFVIHLVTVFINLQNIIEYANVPFDNYDIKQIAAIFSPNSANSIFVFIIGAFLAYDYFRFLHSRKESDFYESLPISKTQHFKLNMICCFSIFFVLFLVTFVVEILVAFVFGVGEFIVWSNVFWNILLTVGIYLASWITASLAMIMTGHTLIAVLGFGAFNVYFPILIKNLYPVFAQSYFNTYVKMPGFEKFNLINVVDLLSPGSLTYHLINYRTDYWEFKDHQIYFIGLILFILIIGFITYKLFLRRPSESAGQSMAFRKANSTIRIITVIPIALYIGLFLKSIGAYASEAWLIFGILFAGLIVHGLMQGIFESDAKAVLKKKRQLLLSYAICFGFMSIFWFDIFQFDEYIPKESKVENVYVYTDEGNSSYNDGYSLENIHKALKAAQDITVVDDELYGNHTVDNKRTSVKFEYELKNGMMITRRYLYTYDNVPEGLIELSKEKEYKDDHCPLYYNNSDYYTHVYYKMDYNNQKEIIKNDTVRLFKAYLNDYENFTIENHHKELVLYQFECEYEHEDGYNDAHWFNVYESFDETIKVLKELGCKTFAEDESITIISVDIYRDHQDPLVITNEEQLKILKSKCYTTGLNNSHYEQYVHGYARCKSPNGEFYTDVYISQEDYLEIL